MHLIRRLQDTQGIGVRGGKDGGIIDGLGKQFLRHLIAVGDGGTGKLAVDEALLEPQLLTGFHVALRPELVGGGVAAAEVQDVPVAQLIEVFGADIGAPAVVHSHVALGLVPEVLTEEHRGDLVGVGPDVLIGLGALGDDEDAVHLPSQQQLDHRLLLLQIRAGVAQHHVIAMGPGAHLRVIGQLGHKGVVDGGHHQADEVRLLHHHGAGHVVGGIAHLVAELDDALPGVATDLGTARQGAGNRGIGDARRLGDIFQGHTFHLYRLLHAAENRKRFRFIFLQPRAKLPPWLFNRSIYDFPDNVNNNLYFSRIWAEKRKSRSLFGICHIDKAAPLI